MHRRSSATVTVNENASQATTIGTVGIVNQAKSQDAAAVVGAVAGPVTEVVAEEARVADSTLGWTDRGAPTMQVAIDSECC